MTARAASPYAGQRAVLATQHGKGRALIRPFTAGLGLALIAPEGIDTDALGTFSGEIERHGPPREVVIAKARLGMAQTGMAIGVASEATFGPHPVIPILAAGHELLAFVDNTRGLLLVESLICEQTNFAHLVLKPGDDPHAFLARIGFPAHAVIVRPSTGAGTITKGIVTEAKLAQAIAAAASASADGRARIETDMRAHVNPTRMRALRRLGFRMVRRLLCPCPACGAPGFGRVSVRAGLPCSDCGEPTSLVAAEIFGCAVCAHREERPRADGRVSADAGACAACNP